MTVDPQAIVNGPRMPTVPHHLAVAIGQGHLSPYCILIGPVIFALVLGLPEVRRAAES